jgi:hypothetical protein
VDSASVNLFRNFGPKKVIIPKCNHKYLALSRGLFITAEATDNLGLDTASWIEVPVLLDFELLG